MTRWMSLALATLAMTTPTISAQTCLKYNVLTLDVIYHDVCNRGSCMNATTFIADFDLPDGRFGQPNGYANGPRTINGYRQDFCAAITRPNNTDGTPDLSLRPWGCDSPNCSDDPYCDFTSNIGTGQEAGLASGQVQPILGDDGVPVFKAVRVQGQKKSIASSDTFGKWYHDTPATIRIDAKLNLTRQYDLATNNYEIFEYKNDFFFPLDRIGYYPMGDWQGGNDFRIHNFGFTTRIHSDFAYYGGEHFTFQGDDDIWVFIDGRLVIDIGGVHDNQCRSIFLDDFANGGTGHVYNCLNYQNVNMSDIRPGEDFTVPNFIRGSTGHRLDIFHAERHFDSSHFAMSTSIALTGLNNTGPDYTAPSPLATKLTIQADNYAIKLPDFDGNGSTTDVKVQLSIAPIAATDFYCQVLSYEFVGPYLNFSAAADDTTTPPPFNLSQILTNTSLATWASVTTEQEVTISDCLRNSADNQFFYVTIQTTAAGKGYLYCIADSDTDDPNVFNDYTATGTARGKGFHKKWAAVAIESRMPPSPTPAPSSMNSESDSSMSTGAKAGMGVGIGIGALLILIVIGFAYKKRGGGGGTKQSTNHVDLDAQNKKLGVGGDSEHATSI